MLNPHSVKTASVGVFLWQSGSTDHRRRVRATESVKRRDSDTQTLRRSETPDTQTLRDSRHSDAQTLRDSDAQTHRATQSKARHTVTGATDASRNAKGLQSLAEGCKEMQGDACRCKGL